MCCLMVYSRSCGFVCGIRALTQQAQHIIIAVLLQSLPSTSPFASQQSATVFKLSCTGLLTSHVRRLCPTSGARFAHREAARGTSYYKGNSIPSCTSGMSGNSHCTRTAQKRHKCLRKQAFNLQLSTHVYPRALLRRANFSLQQ